jgi:uncharacterized protein with HEPN domain
MKERTAHRLSDIIDSIDAIHSLLEGKTFEDMASDRVTKAAFERFLEILSEASRHIPETLKAKAPDVPWRRVGDIGNHLRHAYHRVDPVSFGTFTTAANWPPCARPPWNCVRRSMPAGRHRPYSRFSNQWSA